jgi:hypothetical protein
MPCPPPVTSATLPSSGKKDAIIVPLQAAG